MNFLPCLVFVPANCVDTYDISLEMAEDEDIPAHPAALLHAVFLYAVFLYAVFLYNMERNGIKIVSHFG